MKNWRGSWKYYCVCFRKKMPSLSIPWHCQGKKQKLIKESIWCEFSPRLDVFLFNDRVAYVEDAELTHEMAFNLRSVKGKKRTIEAAIWMSTNHLNQVSFLMSSNVCVGKAAAREKAEREVARVTENEDLIQIFSMGLSLRFLMSKNAEFSRKKLFV